MTVDLALEPDRQPEPGCDQQAERKVDLERDVDHARKRTRADPPLVSRPATLGA
jgi:hypothetical protein